MHFSGLHRYGVWIEQRDLKWGLALMTREQPLPPGLKRSRGRQLISGVLYSPNYDYITTYK